MLRVIVCGGGWGAELVADYLQSELEIIEVVRIIDWREPNYSKLTPSTRIERIEAALKAYQRHIDLVVLGDYAATTVIETLCTRNPQFNFVGMDVDAHRILRASHYPTNITILADSSFENSKIEQILYNKLADSAFTVLQPQNWVESINAQELDEDLLYKDLSQIFQLPQRSSGSLAQTLLGETETKAHDDHITKLPNPDAVLLLNTYYWEIKKDLEAVFGWRVRVLDFRQQLLHDVCRSLKLRGVDGHRAR